MRFKILTLVFWCLVLTTPAEAGTTWLGAQLHFPVPAGDVGNSQLGVDAGVSVTQMQGPWVGIGADLGYHYWPASSGYEAAFNRYLRTERMEALTSPEWALSALQMTGHVKFVVPAGKRCAAWMKVGAGAYRLNLNLDQQWPSGTYATVRGAGLGNIKLVAGGYGSIGLDVRASSRVVLGLNATLHYVGMGERSPWGWRGMNDLQDFSAVTVGMHAMFAAN
jgi:hypothetical protein